MKPGNRQCNDIEMVPIHTKQMLWQMRERDLILLCLSAYLREGIFEFKFKEVPAALPIMPIGTV